MDDLPLSGGLKLIDFWHKETGENIGNVDAVSPPIEF